MTWFRPRNQRAGDLVPRSTEPPLDTVGNPILQRSPASAGTRHPAPTRAEHRVLQFVTEGRVALPLDAPRASTGAVAGGFWLIDDALAAGTKAMMLDWLLEQGYITRGPRTRTAFTIVLTPRGRELVDQRG